jgi:hypothetical protein
MAFTPSNPDELVNAQELAQTLGMTAAELERNFGARLEQSLEQRAAQILGKVQEEVSAGITALEDAREINGFNTQIDQTIGKILADNPALKAIPRINALLREEVKDLKPRTPEEMLEAFHVVSSGILEGLNHEYNRSRHPAVQAKQEMVAGGIEPPKGLPPNTTVVADKPNYIGKDGKFDFKQLRNIGRQFLNDR